MARIPVDPRRTGKWNLTRRAKTSTRLLGQSRAIAPTPRASGSALAIMDQFRIRSTDPGSAAPPFQQSWLDGRFALTNFRLIYSRRSVSRRQSLVNFLSGYRLHIGRRLCRMDFCVCGILQGHSERKTVADCDVQRGPIQRCFCDRRWRAVFGRISPK